jgi:hypothetical protein
MTILEEKTKMDKRIPKLISLFSKKGEKIIYSESTTCSFARLNSTTEYRVERWVNNEQHEDIFISNKQHEVVNALIEALARLNLGEMS